MAINFYIRHYGADWLKWLTPRLVDDVACTVPTKWFTVYSNPTTQLLAPDWQTTSTSNFEENCGNEYFVGVVARFENDSADTPIIARVQDSNWTAKGWNLTSDDTLTGELCTFFKNQFSVAYPWTTDLNLIIFRGIPPTMTTAQTMAFCYWGNDPFYHETRTV